VRPGRPKISPMKRIRMLSLKFDVNTQCAGFRGAVGVRYKTREYKWNGTD
jgi:hypothetical protein